MDAVLEVSEIRSNGCAVETVSHSLSLLMFLSYFSNV
jgi:hypothetical protein